MKNRKRLYILIGLIALLSLVNVSPIIASGEYDAQSLRGIKEFAVAIEYLPPEIEKEGLTKDIIQTDVELKLRLAGIKVITMEESYKVSGYVTYIYVNVYAGKLEKRGYIYSINVDFKQGVILLRNNMITGHVSTWGTGYFGFTPESTSDAFQIIRGRVKDRIDIFINDYLSVNPK